MYDFLLQIFFFSTLAVIVYLMARALPRVTEEDNKISFLDYLERWVKRLPLSKADHFVSLRLEKILRTIRVIIMRLDNFIHKYLDNKKNGTAKSPAEEWADSLKKES